MLGAASLGESREGPQFFKTTEDVEEVEEWEEGGGGIKPSGGSFHGF